MKRRVEKKDYLVRHSQFDFHGKKRYRLAEVEAIDCEDAIAQVMEREKIEVGDFLVKTRNAIRWRQIEAIY